MDEIPESLEARLQQSGKYSFLQESHLQKRENHTSENVSQIRENGLKMVSQNNAHSGVEIPVIELKGADSRDPIKLIEAMSNLGAQYGAIKFVIPEGPERERFANNLKIDPKTFWFASTKQLGRPQNRDLESRLHFHSSLARFHTEMGAMRIPFEETKNEHSLTVKEEEGKKNGVKSVLMEASNEEERAFDIAETDHLNVDSEKAKEASSIKSGDVPEAGQMRQENVIFDPPTNEPISPKKEPFPAKKEPQSIPSFIKKPPSISGRTIDLYSLFKAVVFRGGLDQVEESNLWVQIASNFLQKEDLNRELATLKNIYITILLPFEKLAFGRAYSSKKSALKRPFQDDKQAFKRAHVEDAPLILGSAKEFRRSTKVKASKGILLNSPHLVGSRKCTPSSREPRRRKASTKSMTPQQQLNHIIRNTYLNQTITQDSSAQDEHSSYTSLNEFMENDFYFQRALGLEGMSAENKELAFWEFLAKDREDSGPLPEQALDIPSILTRTGLSFLGDGLVSKKRPIDGEQAPSLTEVLRNSLHQWNLHNLPILPNSLLGALSEGDVNNRDLASPVLSVGMTYSTENWRCEEHFTQLCSYHLTGAPKKWYFIPEDQFDKFEELVKEVSQMEEVFDKKKVLLLLSGLECDKVALMNALSQGAFSQPEVRLQHSNAAFQQLILASNKVKTTAFNQAFFITPELLRLRGIRFFMASQGPGEFIFKYPKTYSATVSLGVNVCESVNVATKTWLNYAIEGEKWLAKQHIIPCFLTFKMLLNLAQLYETPGSDIHFSPEVYLNVVEIYNYCFGQEVYLRNLVRKRAKYIREFVVDEKTFGDVDPVSDDSLENTFPSKIVLTDTHTNQTFILTLANFLDYIQANENEENSAEKTVPVLSSEQYRVDLFLFYSDEKLKAFRKTLSSYSVDYERWIRSYEAQMAVTDEISLKNCRSLLADGEKIYVAISLLDFVQEFYGNVPSLAPNNAESTKIGVFKGYIENLRLFLAQSNAFIEECQTLLLVKHQQRIRGNDSAQAKPVDLKALASVIERIAKVNFSCVEFDQIFELQNEIENFDRACKSLFQTSNKSISEFNDLISLGESFGLEIPSLTFIIRLRDRLKWLQVYNVIVSGGDPFGDKKDHFTVVDLKMFFSEGLRILGRNDTERAETIQSIIAESDAFNTEVDVFFGQVSALDEMNLQLFDGIYERFEKKAKSTGPKRVFMSFENLVRLLDVKGHYNLFPRFKEFREYAENAARTNEFSFAYHEVKGLKTAIDESKLAFNSQILVNALFAAERWVFHLWENLRDSQQVTTFKSLVGKKDGINARYSLNGPLIKKLLLMAEKNRFSFANESDTYYLSAAYQANKEKEEETHSQPDGEETEDEVEEARKGPEKSCSSADKVPQTPEPEAPMIYCICREYEFGTMIECDHCNEWYHIHCVEDQGSSDDDSYMCPVCKLLTTEVQKDAFLQKQGTLENLQIMLEEGKALKTCPLNEYNKLSELCSSTNEHKRAVFTKILEIKNSTVFSLRKKSGYLKFMLRKVYGAGVVLEDILSDLLQVIRVYDKALREEGDARKAQIEQQEREFREREGQMRKENEEAELLSKVAQLAAFSGIEPTITPTSGVSLPSVNLETLPKVKTFAAQNGNVVNLQPVHNFQPPMQSLKQKHDFPGDAGQ